MVKMSGMSENGVLLLCCGFRRSAHRKPETLHFQAGSIARIQELAALNGPSAVRFKTQRRIEKTESYNPAGVHCGHPLFTCRYSSMEERRLSKAGHRW